MWIEERIFAAKIFSYFENQNLKKAWLPVLFRLFFGKLDKNLVADFFPLLYFATEIPIPFRNTGHVCCKALKNF
jgi:hypothetical protein